MDTVLIKYLGRKEYCSIWQAMKSFTESRDNETVDEFWILEHDPVYTQGQAGKPEHLLNPGSIPVVQSDRGGQVTYHGPGQLIVYTLINTKRKNLSIRSLVSALEQAIVNLLADYGITAHTQCRAPGVYVENAKIASLGLRIKRGFSYHGLSLNVAMDLEPFQRINPCGYPDLKVIQLSNFKPGITIKETSNNLVMHLMNIFGYNRIKQTINQNEGLIATL